MSDMFGRWHEQRGGNPRDGDERAWAPHCDVSVLHAPGSCEYCDLYPDWQEHRIRARINFTGEDDPEKVPCPSIYFRTLDQIENWAGNNPRPPAVEIDPDDEPWID